jgi:hypothetical protein
MQGWQHDGEHPHVRSYNLKYNKVMHIIVESYKAPFIVEH